MPENHNTPITDDIIRAALRRELDSIEAPPVEPAWQRLQARQAAEAVPAPRRGRTWTRYYSLAAALLLFFFGGYGVYRTLNNNDFYNALLMGSPESASDSANFVTTGVDEEGYEKDGVSFSLAEWDPVELPGDLQFLDTLSGYLINAAFSREAQSGARYLAALYTRDDSTLLWVQSDVHSRDQFVTDLRQLLSTPVETYTSEDDQSRLSVSGLPALIWEKEGRHYLLYQISGDGADTDLKRLIPED